MLSPLETLDGPVLPAAEPPRGSHRRRWLVATAAFVTLVLAGGAVAAVVVLNRPDVRLQRALSATTDQPVGDVTASLRIVGNDGEGADLAVLTSPSMTLAWDRDSGTREVTGSWQGTRVVDMVATPDTLVLTLKLLALHNADVTKGVAQMRRAATSIGPQGAPITALLDGHPVRLHTGPGSALDTLVKKAAANSTTISPDQADAVRQQMSDALVRNVTVTDAGTDADGDHLVATFPLKPVIQPAVDALPASMRSGPGAALAKLDAAATVSVDVWVRDGTVAKVVVPLNQLVRDLGGDVHGAPDVQLVLAFGSDGPQAPAATDVTDVPDSLLTTLTQDSGGGSGAGGLALGG
ncbi:MAG: hypothetical protein GC157_13950 [Frankiales bacterium]|nr:hypothetical protein [Frankiales bacterium]